MSEITRSLASAKRITAINPIPGAEAIECAIVGGGWSVVIRKGEFYVNQIALYLEIDSWVPNSIAPFLSRGKEPREFNGVYGERLRTIKLRGQISQGLLLPLPEWAHEGDDLTEKLGIQKWERPMPACLRGMAKGSFPSWLRKTDQDRVQNLDGKIDWNDEYEITTKLDGSSMTIWFKNGEWGVCSRNIDLKIDQEGNTFVDMAKKVIGNLDWPDGLAWQGELMGPGIQGNRENLKEHEFFVFDIWDITAQRHLPPATVRRWCDGYGINHVPVLFESSALSAIAISSIASALQFAEGPSINNTVREGVVFKRVDGGFSFKAISDAFLLGEK